MGLEGVGSSGEDSFGFEDVFGTAFSWDFLRLVWSEPDGLGVWCLSEPSDEFPFTLANNLDVNESSFGILICCFSGFWGVVSSWK